MARIDLTNGKVWSNVAAPPAIKVAPPGRKLSNWLMSYGEYTGENEAPESFHLWVGLGTIAGATRRQISLRTAFFDVLTNLYVILVAPPGTARKTTALKIGQGILKEVPGIHFTTQATSGAALVKQFASLPEREHQSLTAYSYELGSMFQAGSVEMVDLVTDLYDGNPDWSKQTIARGPELIPRPWFNLMAATTPQWLGDHLSPTAVEGGFVSRSLFVFADQRRLSNPFPEITEANKALKKDLINDLTHISTISGEFSFSTEARAFYEEWYLDPKRFPRTVDERVTGYYERKHIHVLKVAMAVSLAEKDELVLERRDLELAIALLDSIEPGMKRSFASVGRNIYATDLERIRAQINSKGGTGMAYGEIIRYNYHALNKLQIDEILQQLTLMGSVTHNKGTYYGCE